MLRALRHGKEVNLFGKVARKNQVLPSKKVQVYSTESSCLGQEKRRYKNKSRSSSITYIEFLIHSNHYHMSLHSAASPLARNISIRTARHQTRTLQKATAADLGSSCQNNRTFRRRSSILRSRSESALQTRQKSPACQSQCQWTQTQLRPQQCRQKSLFTAKLAPSSPNSRNSRNLSDIASQRSQAISRHLSTSSSTSDKMAQYTYNKTPSEYTPRVVGQPFTLDYRCYIEKNGQPVSPFHDIPLYANEQQTILNMVVEIPRWSNAKQEVCTDSNLPVQLAHRSV